MNGAEFDKRDLKANRGLKDYLVYHFDAAFHYILEEGAIEELTQTFNYEAKVLLLYSLFPGLFCGVLKLLDIETAIMIWFAVVGTSYCISKNEETDEEGTLMHTNQGLKTPFFWFRSLSILIIILGSKFMALIFRAFFSFESLTLFSFLSVVLSEYLKSLCFLGIYRFMTSVSVAMLLKFMEFLNDERIQDLPMEEYKEGQRYMFKRNKKQSPREEPTGQNTQGKIQGENAKESELFLQLKAHLENGEIESEEGDFHSPLPAENSSLGDLSLEEVKEVKGDHNLKMKLKVRNSKGHENDVARKLNQHLEAHVEECQKAEMEIQEVFEEKAVENEENGHRGDLTVGYLEVEDVGESEKLVREVSIEKFMTSGNFLPFQRFLKASGKLVKQTDKANETNELGDFEFANSGNEMK